ncbi:uncharacterized protein LOC129571460 [Sitodiplosis mosellana]|uniref:uncharacterized protein LOC129571460 n=1 Tax=Sitodiplosis mosellana TaxID=263140 RepID=UPI002443E16A|nr:uncharacterized protein LOC129571460 [Sitodiplosis mosellana]
MHFVKLSAKESANLTIDAVLIFWQQARIPTRRKDKCTDKIVKIYDDWKAFNKVKVEQMSFGMKEKFSSFMDDLDDLFDIAAADALETMRNEEDKEFLEKQRQKGRPGSMLGVDMKLAGKEERSKLRKEKEDARKTRHEQATNLQQSVNYEGDSDIEYNTEVHDVFEVPPQQTRRSTPKKKWITPRLCAALDKAKLSNREAMHILMATVDALKIPADNLVLNCTSL